MVALSQIRSIRLLLLAGLLLQAAGCGTIFWPERKGQPAGRLDPKVVALDAVGLLLFFVPGVIAFAVDFNNGTIYLPPEEHAGNEPHPSEWTRVTTENSSPAVEEIERIIRERTGKKIQLQPGQYRVSRLTSSDDLAGLSLNPLSLASGGELNGVRFRAQSE